MEAINIDHLYVSYGQSFVLRDVSLQVQEGEFLGIIGPNGGGKSTLLKALLGLLPIDSGKVQIFGEDPLLRKSVVGYTPQFSSVDRRFPISVFEVALTGRMQKGFRPFMKYSQNDKEYAYAQLERVGIEKLYKRQILELSGGEYQRLLIARALAAGPKLLILDEPTASVDAGSREKIYRLLEELNHEMTIVMVTHDLLAISSTVKKLACLNGDLVFHGEPEMNEKIVNELYGCPVDLIAHGVPHRVLQQHEHKGGNGCC